MFSSVLGLAFLAINVAATGVSASLNHTVSARPFFPVPSLVAIRDILSQLEAPIVSTLTQRLALTSNPALYANNGSKLFDYIRRRETVAQRLHRFDYGKLEYPFTLPAIAPDVTTSDDEFPPGRFHQDTFTGNANLSAFYLNTLVPSFNSTTAYFFHLDNSTENDDAAMNLDATLLSLMSHRAHIGKIVAETKYASNVTGFTPLIRVQNADTIRVLLTNTTQEAGVLAQAQTAANALSSSWVTSGALVPSTFGADLQAAAAKLFRELIDITTQIEIEYLLQRLT
ncbi:hypothetical protein PLICRDRAFT_169570 [Plicaturopsis crispa FD-325 SS-3]|nr:hypothetical protein PLICRDRAFT_169570 [Plicaturopsis crispa FD-325 SS-3]